MSSRCVMLGLALAMPLSAQAASLFTVDLDGAQEIGGSSSPATASGSLSLSFGPAGAALDYVVDFDDTHDFGPVLGGNFGNIDGVQQDPATITGGTDVTLLHIHNAPRGENGGVVYGMINPDQDTDNDVTLIEIASGFRLEGQWDLDEGAGLAMFLGALRSAQAGEDVPLYFNLHTPDDPGGAIRGQIVAANGVDPIPLPAPLALMLAALGSLGVAGRLGRRRR